MDVRSLYISLKHERDLFARNEIKKVLFEKLTNLTGEEAKYILTLIENYIDTQEAYYQAVEELKQTKEIVKQLCKTLNLI
jgi:predicted DNA-binding protein